MREKFTEAHRLTKKIKTENPNINYRTQFAICLKFVIKNSKKEFGFDINTDLESQKMFAEEIRKEIEKEIFQDYEREYFYSDFYVSSQYWEGGKNKRFYFNTVFKYKKTRSSKMYAKEEPIGFMFVDINDMLQYGDGFNGIDNKFRNLIEKNYDSILKNVETKYNKKNELKNRTINAIKNFFEKSIVPDAKELFIENFNKIEFNFTNEIEKVKEIIDFGTVIAYEKLDEINFYNILSTENKKIINEIATEILKQKSI